MKIISFFIAVLLIAAGFRVFQSSRKRKQESQARIALEKARAYELEIAETDREYRRNFENLLSQAIGLLLEINANYSKGGLDIEPMLFRAYGGLRRGRLIVGGVWSKAYLFLMEILKNRIPEEVFSRLEKLNRSVADASLYGHMQEECINVCERRRKELLDNLEKSIQDLRMASCNYLRERKIERIIDSL